MSGIPRFIDNNDGTVTDTKTGLMWVKDTTPGVFTWLKAIEYCEGLGDGWRLPTIEELISIVDYNRFDPAIDPIFECKLSYYWSSTTNAGNPSNAWVVYFYDGSLYYGNKSFYGYYVRAVRSLKEKP